VLLVVLNTAPEDAFLRELAVEWLKLNEFSLIYWGKLWLLLNIKRPKDSSITFMEAEGIKFLEATLDLADGRSVETWSLVWNRIRRRRSLSERLISLAHDATPEFYRHKKFVEFVLSNIASQDFARKHVVTWLQTSPQGTISWSDIFVRLVKQSNPDEEILMMGKNWLQSHPNLNRWKNVWDALFLKGYDPRSLVEIARKWLERAYPDITVWPKVMCSVLESGTFTSSEIDVATQWLASHPKRATTKSYRELKLALEKSQILST
jgi:hypothetical protein